MVELWHFHVLHQFFIEVQEKVEPLHGVLQEDRAQMQAVLFRRKVLRF